MSKTENDAIAGEIQEQTDLRPDENLLLAVNVTRVEFAHLLEYVPPDVWYVHYSMPYLNLEGVFAEGFLLVTDSRVAFFRRVKKTEKMSVWKTLSYVSEKSIKNETIISCKVLGDAVQLIHNSNKEADVFIFGRMYEIDPKKPGNEVLRKRVNPNYVADIISSVARLPRSNQ